MELSFQSQPYHFLRNVMQEVRYFEETADLIVPDSYPDIGDILECFAQAILRGKDCREGSTVIAGGVKGSVLYTPEDGSCPKALEAYIPFSVKFENAELSGRTQVLSVIRVCSADARMINSRKAMLRVGMWCEICAFEDCVDEHYRLEKPIAGLQLKEASYRIRTPLETDEKSFAVNDMLELPAEGGDTCKIYDFQCCPELTDEKLVGNKAVFKGILHCTVLYLNGDQQLRSYQQAIPFSQYCELIGDYDQETVQTKLMVTGYDLNMPANEADPITVSVNILAQCVISGIKTLELIEDAYAIDGKLTPLWKEYAQEAGLDQQSVTQTLRERVNGDLSEVLCASAYWSYPTVARNGDKTVISTPVSFRLFGRKENGTLQAVTVKGTAAYDLDLSDRAECKVTAVPAGAVYTVMEQGGMEVRCELDLSVSCYAKEKLKTLCGGEVEPTDEDSHKPALIVRMVEKDTPLWDLAKSCSATVADITAANGIDETVLSKDTVLLVPVS